MDILWTNNRQQLNWPTSTLLAELENILQIFPEINEDNYLQHLHSVELIAYLTLDNTHDMLTRSQMLKAHDKQ